MTNGKTKRLISIMMVALTLLALVPMVSAAEYATVNADGTLFRKSAHSSTKETNLVAGCATLNQGDTVEIIAKTASFYQVTFGVYTGYVYRTEVTLGAAAASSGDSGASSGGSTSTGSSGGTTTTTASGMKVVGSGTTKETVYLRVNPDKSTDKSNVVVKISKGKTLEVFGMTTDKAWYYCRYDGKYVGYARVKDINYKSTSSGTSTITGGTATKLTTIDTPIPSRLSLGSDGEAKWKATYRNFKSQYEKNSDTVGWIYVPGTNINYPIMFSSSWYYNDHTPAKKSASSGSIYAYSSGLCNITTISGHNSRVSRTMFHALHHIKAALLGKSKCEYTKRCSASVSSLKNATIFNITMGDNTAWQVWGAYEVPKGTSSDVVKYNCYNHTLSGDGLNTWIATQLKKSKDYGLNLGVSVSSSDKIIVLSTCGTSTGDNNARLYMFLKAIG